MDNVSVSWGEVAGCGIDHPPPSSTRVKEGVELYLCSPSGSEMAFLGVNFILCNESVHCLGVARVYAVAGPLVGDGRNMFFGCPQKPWIYAYEK